MSDVNARLAGIDPRLYFVTDPLLCASAHRSVAATAAAAVAGGAGVVQVRAKQLDDRSFYELVRSVYDAVRAATAGTRRHVPVVVNDRVQTAERLREEGIEVHIHVGQQDMPVARVRAHLGPAPLLGLSVSTAAELAAAEATGVVDLVGLSPAFETATKPDAGVALGVARIAELAGTTTLPAFAIGGVTAARARALRDSGITGVCVASAICAADDPRAAAAEILAAFGGPSGEVPG